MNEFDLKASGWDNNPMHIRRSEAVASYIRKLIPVNKNMNALEFGAGTGTTSLFLANSLSHITMVDSSRGMVDVMNEKIRTAGSDNLKAIHFDIENEDFDIEGFDLIFTQMVLHHVNDINSLIGKFSDLLYPGGYLAIADLYPEDGSFHGKEFTGHRGFDPDELAGLLRKYNFINPVHMPCFTIEKEIEGPVKKKFDLFIITAQLKK